MNAINKCPIFTENFESLKEISKDDSDKANIIYIYDTGGRGSSAF